MSSQPLPAPGPSYLRPVELAPGDPRSVGMSEPQTMADGWWVALLWCEEAGKLAMFDSLAPSGPPSGSPLQRLGPALAGLLSGLIAAEGARLQMRLRLAQPPGDPAQPWGSNLVVLAAFKFEPARVATLRPNELALTVLVAFRDALRRMEG